MQGRNIEIDIKLDTKMVTISEHFINCVIKKTDSPELNEATITIINLSPDLRKAIRKNQSCTIRAGYTDQGGPVHVFQGNITSITGDTTPPDIKTEIIVSDGELKLKNQSISVSFGENATVKKMLKEITSKIGLPIGTNIDKLNFVDKVFANGFSFTGTIDTAMKKVCDFVGLDYSSMDEVIKIYDRLKAEKQIHLIENSLIGSPKPTTIKDKRSGKELDGWNITSLFLPIARPHGTIQFKSKEAPNGVNCTVREFTHNLNNYEGDFTTDILAVSL